MPKPRILIVANKWWEADPLMNVLLSESRATPRRSDGQSPFTSRGVAHCRVRSAPAKSTQRREPSSI